MDIRMDVVPHFKGFQFVGCLKQVHPGTSQTFSVAFEPVDDLEHREVLRLYDRNSVSISLKGKGFLPEIEIENGGELLDLEDVLLGEESSKVFKIRNPTMFELDFSLKSLPLNYDSTVGKKVFCYSPQRGKIAPGETLSIKIVF